MKKSLFALVLVLAVGGSATRTEAQSGHYRACNNRREVGSGGGNFVLHCDYESGSSCFAGRLGSGNHTEAECRRVAAYCCCSVE